MTTPSTAIIMGSIKLESASTASSTSRSKKSATLPSMPSSEPDSPPIGRKYVRHLHDNNCRRRQAGPESLKQFLELGNHKYHDYGRHNEGDHKNGNRVKQRFLDLALDRHDLFLIGGQTIKQGIQNTGLFASADQIAIKRIEVQRILAKRLGKTAPGLNIGLDIQQQLGNRRIAMPLGDNIKSLQQGHTGFHHGRQLAGKKCDVLRGNPFAAFTRNLFHLGANDALTPQGGVDDALARRTHLALDEFPRFVLAFPNEGVGFDALCIFSLNRCSSHRHSLIDHARMLAECARRYSLVTASISSSDVRTDFTLRRPDWRRSDTPSRSA